MSQCELVTENLSLYLFENICVGGGAPVYAQTVNTQMRQEPGSIHKWTQIFAFLTDTESDENILRDRNNNDAVLFLATCHGGRLSRLRTGLRRSRRNRPKVRSQRISKRQCLLGSVK